MRTYNEDDEENSNDSFGSISSADERDIKLLTTGVHKYYFNAVKRIEEFTAEKMKDNLEAIKCEQEEERKLRYARYWGILTCRDCRKKESK